MIDFKALLTKIATPQTLMAANFGLEREGQRVTTTGQLAQTAFPTIFKTPGSHIQRDFAETQLELVTPVETSAEQVVLTLQQLQTTVQRILAPQELIWPLSMPPALPLSANQIPIARLDDRTAVRYRHHLARVYGRRRQMLSGVHLNIELAPQLMQQLFLQQHHYSTFTAFKAAVYFKIARNYLHYRWLITYLFGATPLSEANFFVTTAQPTQPVRSIRNSRYGYTNATKLHVSYASLPQYVADLQAAVTHGQLSAMKEFYGQIRLRGGQQMTDLRTAGVQYLELRHLDLNPFAPTGITVAQIKFIQAFLLLMLTLPEQAPADQWVAQGTARNQAIALTSPLAGPLWLVEGQSLLDNLMQFCNQFQLTAIHPLVHAAQQTLLNPKQTLAARWWQAIQATDQPTVALKFAQQYQAMDCAK